MDQKVVCMFLLILGVSHGLQCYGGDYGTGKKNFDAATARKLACRDNEDVCQKIISADGSIDLRCVSKDKFARVSLNKCTEDENDDRTICLCTGDLCNKCTEDQCTNQPINNNSTMINGGMVLIFALMGIFMLKM